MINRLADALHEAERNYVLKPGVVLRGYQKKRADAWEAIARRAVSELSAIANAPGGVLHNYRGMASGAIDEIGELPPVKGEAK